MIAPSTTTQATRMSALSSLSPLAEGAGRRGRRPSNLRVGRSSPSCRSVVLSQRLSITEALVPPPLILSLRLRALRRERLAALVKRRVTVARAALADLGAAARDDLLAALGDERDAARLARPSRAPSGRSAAPSRAAASRRAGGPVGRDGRAADRRRPAGAPAAVPPLPPPPAARGARRGSDVRGAPVRRRAADDGRRGLDGAVGGLALDPDLALAGLLVALLPGERRAVGRPGRARGAVLLAGRAAVADVGHAGAPGADVAGDAVPDQVRAVAVAAQQRDVGALAADLAVTEVGRRSSA